MRLILLSLFFTTLLFSQTKQVIFVLADSFNSQTAKLIRYEKIKQNFKQISSPIEVNIGLNGLAWSTSNYKFKISKNEPKKIEGDKKTPAGVFNLSKVFTYHDKINTKMPYEKVTKNHICVDDTNSNMYNKVIKTKNKENYRSFENMLLKNETYEYVVLVDHNQEAKKGFGSCIFLHVENPKKKQTSGCTSMKINHIEKLVNWLDIKKEPILIQIPKKGCFRIKKNYPFINCNL